MAGNSDDVTRKILVDVEVRSEQLKKDVPVLVDQISELKAEIVELTKEQKKAAEQEGRNSVEYRKSTAEIVAKERELRRLKVEVRENNKYIDNTYKALNAESNSIQQNRALLSLLTSEHIKLGQANGNTKAQVDASAKAINNLTDVLKAQEKAIGQNYRNVGNYADAIREVAGELGSAIPGFQQFQTIIQGATKVAGFMPTALANIGSAISKTSQQVSSFVGFKQFAVQAEETTGQVEGTVEAVTNLAGAETAAATEAEGAASSIGTLGAAGGILAGAFAVIGLAVAGAIQYLKRLDSVGDTLQQKWEGLKGGLYAVAESIKQGDFSSLATDFWAAAGAAAGLTEKMQDLQDAMIGQEVKNAQAENQIQDLMLKMRNKRTTPEQEQQYFDKITKISTDSYKQRKDQADRLYEIEVQNAVNGKKLSQQEIDALRKGGTDKAIELENQDKIWVGSYKKIADAQKAQIAADAFFNSVRDRSQNRIDAKQLADEQKQQAAKSKADADARRAEQQRQRESDAYLDSENTRKSSAGRELQTIYEQYGDRAIAAQSAYDNEINKLNKFLAKKLITQKQYDNVEAQLKKEHESNVAAIIDDFRKKDYDAFVQSRNSFRSAAIANIAEDTAREVAGLKQRYSEEGQVIDANNKIRLENIKALDIEISKLAGVEKKEAEDRRENEYNLIQLDEQRRVELERSTQEAILKVRRRAENDQQLTKDGRSVKDTKKTSNVFNDGGLKAAELKAIHDKYQYEIDENKRALAAVEADNTLSMAQKLEAEKALRGKIKESESQEQDEIAAIQKAHLVAKVDFYAAAEQQIQGALMDLFSQSIQQQESAALASAEARKNGELNNASLTNTQKKLIDAKYDKEERKIKLKAFKDNQKLQIANALINGAVAVIKNIAEMGFIPSIPANILTVALTAIEVGKIASQKPGFATGGQYVSDGRGAALPGYSTRDNINATLRDGEGVVVSEAMRVPWARNTISSINEQFGGRSFSIPGNYGLSMPAFASGGQFTDGGNANRYYSQPIINSGELANSIAYQLINNMPAIMVDVKDINTQQGILAQTLDRVNL